MGKKDIDNQIEDLPIEEFENDNQDFREEFLKQFEEKKEEVKKSQNEDEIYKRWL